MATTDEQTASQIVRVPAHEVLTERASKELAPGVTFEFDLRNGPGDARMRPEFFRCGNCGKRLPRAFDLEADHHTAMKHRVEECPKIEQAAIEHFELVEDFHRQQLLIAPPAERLPWWRRFFNALFV